MKLANIIKAPLWAAGVALGNKSFRDNPIIRNRFLNEKGFHVQRMLWAERMADFRRKQMSNYLDQADRDFFHENGYIVKHNALPEDIFNTLQEELKTTEFSAREMKQGCTVTRFIPVYPAMLKNLPGLNHAVNLPLFQNGLRYVASNNADPMIFLSAVMRDPESMDVDPQTNLHADTFCPIAKCWLFLDEVTQEDGPFHYVPGSHRMTEGRRQWEYEQSLQASTHQDVHHSVGSFRVDEDELEQMGYGKPVPMIVPANTLVIADTHGFHARGKATHTNPRIGLYGSLRRSPFVPWTGLDIRSLPGIKGRQSAIFDSYLNFRANVQGRGVPHVDVGKVKVDAPPRR